LPLVPFRYRFGLAGGENKTMQSGSPSFSFFNKIPDNRHYLKMAFEYSGVQINPYKIEDILHDAYHLMYDDGFDPYHPIDNDKLAEYLTLSLRYSKLVPGDRINQVACKFIEYTKMYEAYFSMIKPLVYHRETQRILEQEQVRAENKDKPLPKDGAFKSWMGPETLEKLKLYEEALAKATSLDDRANLRDRIAELQTFRRRY